VVTSTKEVFLMLRDVQTAASELQVGQSTLRRWIREGRLPVVRLGRHVLLRSDVIEELITSNEVPSAGDSDTQTVTTRVVNVVRTKLGNGQSHKNFKQGR
jgi:excisionase family DNA binding protein